MITYCIAQGTLLNALWWPKWEGNPKNRWDICKHKTDSLWSTTESNTTLQSNYMLIKINLKIPCEWSNPRFTAVQVIICNVFIAVRCGCMNRLILSISLKWRGFRSRPNSSTGYWTSSIALLINWNATQTSIQSSLHVPGETGKFYSQI